ncbi:MULTISPECIES: DNA-binding transcriptional regulator HcaR [Paraburkholderia]|uniref:DNA-binding transcriptional regulator HcaR n=1 Tax=Paraburkholderia youngii TaxID=2782701 RepID=A0A7Y6N351_9BURK|nr:DNA-binding transcriptional regulator HcaR [Paraburkholderia youngii]MBB5404665.1 LysR family hca operon transcriptional activator [Paraburkholderia youngii]NUY04190.1 DNA-binding transcriptional regulator HcaR [Paraburkholderia youngii]NVI03692.1 DNA-binding transcriptional regulator HcaR [Paraburkholderia youngii]
MELRHLRYFIAVAEELSFTRAAERLRTAQPSLSQQIRDLEEQVGTPLFERTRRKVELTEAGKVFLIEARLTLAQAERAVTRARHIGRKSSSTVTIGFVPAAEVRIFPGILPRLRLRFPELNVDLRSIPTSEQEQMLLDNEIDVAFMRKPIRSPDILSEVVLREPILVVLPVAHPLARYKRIKPAQLDGEAFISTHPLYSGDVYDVVDGYFKQHGLQPKVIQVATNILLNLNLIGMGLGYGLLPAYTASLTNPAICTRPLVGPVPEIELLMAWRAGNRSPQLDALLELVAHHSDSNPGESRNAS